MVKKRKKPYKFEQFSHFSPELTSTKSLKDKRLRCNFEDQMGQQKRLK